MGLAVYVLCPKAKPDDFIDWWRNLFDNRITLRIRSLRLCAKLKFVELTSFMMLRYSRGTVRLPFFKPEYLPQIGHMAFRYCHLHGSRKVKIILSFGSRKI